MYPKQESVRVTHFHAMRRDACFVVDQIPGQEPVDRRQGKGRKRIHQDADADSFLQHRFDGVEHRKVRQVRCGEENLVSGFRSFEQGNDATAYVRVLTQVTMQITCMYIL